MKTPVTRARGQAMVELLVAALFILIPLFVGIAAVGKLIDVRHTTDMAARYATWERTVWYDGGGDFAVLNEPNRKSDAAIGNEVAARLLNDRSAGAGAVIRDSDRHVAALVNGIDPMWRDSAGVAYLKDAGGLATTIGRETPATDVGKEPLAALGAVAVAGPAGFAPPLPGDNLATVRVALEGVAGNSAVYRRLWSSSAAWRGLDFHADGAILSNTWGANGKAGTRQMVARAVPTAQGLGAIVQDARAGLAPWDPVQPGRIEAGKIAVDVVPPDRLK
ncbi:hypothetical protein HH212_21700 [Massilia forsythiae]|uniref:Uncharacterized protein n=1 Tax=Massilia forsythiae TaxID=2728020 RepID=A0A7Z2W034_9BURK|nr:hypothetical protein [Massilia forsythiae]QJE02313.1 hypothetical protein HH212_21700 [Massilia forsythiae]